MNYWHIVTATVQNTALLLPFFMSMGPGILQTTAFLTLAEGQPTDFVALMWKTGCPFNAGAQPIAKRNQDKVKTFEKINIVSDSTRRQAAP